MPSAKYLNRQNKSIEIKKVIVMTSTLLLAVKKCYVLTRTKKVISVYADGLDCTNEIHRNLKRKFIMYTDVSSHYGAFGSLSVHMKEIAYFFCWVT